VVLINISGLVIYCLLGLFSLLWLYKVFCSSKYNVWKLRYKYNPAKFNQNFNIVIYSHNSEESVVELLENLKKQDYPREKIKINIILDNCTDNSSNLLEILGGAKIWRITTENKPLGRNAAIEWFLDKVLASENTNAFIFLDAQNRINPYLLGNINNAIGEFPVVVGRIRRQSDNTILSVIMDIYEKLNYGINFKARSMTGLSNFISTQILVIRQEILEKVRFINIPDKNPEMIYSLMLAKANIPMVYSDEVSVFRREDYTVKSFLSEKHKEFIEKIKTFKQGLKLLKMPAPLKSKELLLSLIYPNDTIMVLMFCVLAIFSLKTDFIIGAKYLHYMLAFCVITTLYTLILGKFSKTETILWALKIITYPLILFGKDFNLSKIKIQKPSFEFQKIEFKFEMPKISLPKFTRKKKTIGVQVSNGKKDIPCELEIKNKDGFYTAILWFNNKKTCSNQFLRASDSLFELSEKLSQRGLNLKVCQNCGYFESAQDSTHDFTDGSCLLGMAKHDRKEPYSTQIFYGCKFIIPSHAKEMVRKQIKDLMK